MGLIDPLCCSRTRPNTRSRRLCRRDCAGHAGGANTNGAARPAAHLAPTIITDAGEYQTVGDDDRAVLGERISSVLAHPIAGRGVVAIASGITDLA